VYVNVNEILEQAKEYVNRRKPEVTVFEGSATSDPVAVEPWTGSLQETIGFIASLDNTGFRFATKYGCVENLLKLEHKGKTEIRFSVNSAYVVKKFEAGTPPIERRLKAARETSLAGYPLGFLIGPIIHFPEWRREYSSLLNLTREHIPEGVPVSFELITHRFTKRAKSIIEQVYPDTEVPLDEKGRRFKYGQFGYGKYVYEKELMEEMEEFFRRPLGSCSRKAGSYISFEVYFVFQKSTGNPITGTRTDWRNKCGIKDYRLDSRGRRCSSFSHRPDDKAKGTRGRNTGIRPGPYYPWDSGHDEADSKQHS
jgi:DNA repair photolyase